MKEYCSWYLIYTKLWDIYYCSVYYLEDLAEHLISARMMRLNTGLCISSIYIPSLFYWNGFLISAKWNKIRNISIIKFWLHYYYYGTLELEKKTLNRHSIPTEYFFLFPAIVLLWCTGHRKNQSAFDSTERKLFLAAALVIHGTWKYLIGTLPLPIFFCITTVFLWYTGLENYCSVYIMLMFNEIHVDTI